ncbi:hypothetical protein CKAN_00184500 [Cinnamomum micranthum f. kanehirae]|uniref:Uncharacterized protein n=1 Tax=Cinnamomum micranthum f. kanehirae TaxID=337451 RepID=A0A443N4W2_9MAGN|nr:hypothetical protein CKAN_00184500 [Cinnamomum micranthum f. kanehirae]
MEKSMHHMAHYHSLPHELNQETQKAWAYIHLVAYWNSTLATGGAQKPHRYRLRTLVFDIAQSSFSENFHLKGWSMKLPRNLTDTLMNVTLDVAANGCVVLTDLYFYSHILLFLREAAEAYLGLIEDKSLCNTSILIF